MSHGLRDGPNRRGSVVGRMPNSGVLVLPQITKPARKEALRQFLGDGRVVVAGEVRPFAERRAGELGPQVLQQERHAPERAVGQIARGLGAGPIEQLDE